MYTLLNMILVNRENQTLNGVDYHNVVHMACNRLPCFTGQAVLPAFTLNNCWISKKITKGISLKCVAPFVVLPSVYLCDVKTVFSRLGYFCSKEPKCLLPSLQMSPPHPITAPFQSTQHSRNMFLYYQFQYYSAIDASCAFQVVSPLSNSSSKFHLRSLSMFPPSVSLLVLFL